MRLPALRLNRQERNFIAYALDCAAARLADMADESRELGHDASIIEKYNNDEDRVRELIQRFDPEYVS
jgi:hypothetical protein